VPQVNIDTEASNQHNFLNENKECQMVPSSEGDQNHKELLPECSEIYIETDPLQRYSSDENDDATAHYVSSS
jgi:hypothetical protein